MTFLLLLILESAVQGETVGEKSVLMSSLPQQPNQFWKQQQQILEEIANVENELENPALPVITERQNKHPTTEKIENQPNLHSLFYFIKAFQETQEEVDLDELLFVHLTTFLKIIRLMGQMAKENHISNNITFGNIKYSFEQKLSFSFVQKTDISIENEKEQLKQFGLLVYLIFDFDKWCSNFTKSEEVENLETEELIKSFREEYLLSKDSPANWK